MVCSVKKNSLVEIIGVFLLIQAHSQACVSGVASIVLEKSHDTEFGSIFYTLCYQNQMDNECAGKD